MALNSLLCADMPLRNHTFIHSHLTHSYLLKGEDQIECIPCQCALTVKHILIDCVDFSVLRQNYFNVKSLKELFDTIDTRVILKYLKEIGLYYKF
jgi:hypothetical protein